MFAVSGAATPSIDPFPKSSGRFDQRRASLYATKEDAVAPAPGITPTMRPTIVPISVAGQRSRSSRRVGKAVRAPAARITGLASGWAIRWNISETAKRPTIAATTSIPVMSSVRPKVKRREPVRVSSPTVVRNSPKNPEARPLRKLASREPGQERQGEQGEREDLREPKWRTRSPRGRTSAIRTTMLANPPMVPQTSETPSAFAALPCRVSS